MNFIKKLFANKQTVKETQPVRKLKLFKLFWNDGVEQTVSGYDFYSAIKNYQIDINRLGNLEKHEEMDIPSSYWYDIPKNFLDPF